jgi:predicted cupin superfamily sugar epimerase
MSIHSLTADELAARLALSPHPEGGFYRETYRAEGHIDASALPAHGGARSFSTAIYFLVTEGSFSALHCIASDELWHFYAGAPLEIVALDSRGDRRDVHLGLALDEGEVPQAVIPAGWLFGSRVRSPRPSDAPPWSLVGCTVAPGFDFADFELPDRASLIARYPAHRALIESLTRA